MVRLGDVATVVSGSTPKTSVKEYWDGEFCWITPAEIEDTDVVISDTVRKITAKAIADTGLTQLPKGTVLLSSRAPIGKVAITGVEMYCNQGFKNLICSERIYNKFLFWFLKGRTEYLNSLGRGATFKEISKRIVEDIYVPLPPLEIQRKIAKTLDTVSEILAMRKQQLAELDNLIKSIFYDMFGDPVTIEKGWKTLSLNDTCRKITDGTHHSPPSFPEGKYMYITAKNIRKDGLDLDNITYVSEEDHKRIISRCAPEFGDILYIKDGATTGIAQVNNLNEEFSLLSSVALLKPDNSLINPYFLREVLNNDNMYNSIRSNMGGAAITRLTLRKIGAIIIPVPPLSLQDGFSKALLSIEKQKRNIKSAIRETQYLFDSLMSRYFD
jgi:type I restriction enzyme S subunit